MKRILSIVGFGNIGKAVCAQLLSRNEAFVINIMDPNPNVAGAVLDFQHGAQLYPQHQLRLNDFEEFNQSHFIFHCAGAAVPKGKSRLDTCQESIYMTEAIFKDYQPKVEPYIIVVSNPVDIIAYITLKITGLPAKNIVGTGTFLDAIRMNYSIKKRLGSNNLVDAILLGEHGNSVFVSELLSKINGEPLHSKFNATEIESILYEVKQAAGEIKNTQAATIYGVTYCAMRLFEALASEQEHFYPVSTQVPAELLERLQSKDIYLSFYSRICRKGVFPVESELTNKEIEGFQKAASELLPCIPEKYTN